MRENTLETRNEGSSALLVASLFGFSGVALGAFGAHGLKELLLENGYLEVWHTAVLYQLVHTIALLAIGVGRGAGLFSLRGGSWMTGAWSVGVILFSGSLYLLALTGVKWLGAITPLGGLAFLVGWAALVWQAWRRFRIGDKD